MFLQLNLTCHYLIIWYYFSGMYWKEGILLSDCYFFQSLLLFLNCKLSSGCGETWWHLSGKIPISSYQRLTLSTQILFDHLLNIVFVSQFDLLGWTKIWAVKNVKINLPSDMCIQRRLKSESSLSAWRNLASLAILTASSEDCDQTARISEDTCTFFFSHDKCSLILVFGPERVKYKYGRNKMSVSVEYGSF